MHALSQLSYSPVTGKRLLLRLPARVLLIILAEGRREALRRRTPREFSAGLHFADGGGGATVMVVFVETPAPAHSVPEIVVTSEPTPDVLIVMRSPVE